MNPHGSSFAGRVGWGVRPVVVVVDLVRAYVAPGGPFWLGGEDPSVPEGVLRECDRLVAGARAAAVPVVWTQVRYAADLADAGFFAAKVPALACFADGAPGGWGELARTPCPGDTVLVKQHASSFAGTTLAATLHARGVDTVVVAGVSTSGCVRATATDALAAGFRPDRRRPGVRRPEPRAAREQPGRPRRQVRRRGRRRDRGGRPDRPDRSARPST